jgi:hypothetical protein
MKTAAVLFFTLLHALSFRACAARMTFDYGFLENELKNSVKNHVEFRQVSDTPIVYRAWGAWNFAHPASEVANVALDFGNYPKIFRYVYRCDNIPGPKNRVCALGTWYVEGRAAFARVWAIGTIDTLGWSDPLHLRFIAHQNEDKGLENTWRYLEKGWLNYRTYGVGLAAFITAAGPDSCRVGVIAQGLVKKPMPQWLVRLAANVILPRLLDDIEKEIVRRAEEKKLKQPHWYNTLYKTLRKFFLL